MEDVDLTEVWKRIGEDAEKASSNWHDIAVMSRDTAKNLNLLRLAKAALAEIEAGKQTQTVTPAAVEVT